jgi:HD-like signal output (HDOD) protein
LLTSQRERFVEALELSDSGNVPLAKAESALFGFHHAHVGGLLAQRWKLAPAVQAAVAYHHSPASDPTDWARGFLVQAANTFAHRAATMSGGYRGDLCDDDSLQALHLTKEQTAEITAAVASAGID